ncbi:MAG: glycogen/starch synthase [Muribaculaceae bacterium]|nr:glycogen/starch synthase [Muribaculaceae bacterium]
MAENNKILYINQEINPYVAESFRSMLARGLHQGMQEAGFEVRTFMPKYAIINERKNQLHEVIRLSGMNIIIDDSDHPLIIKVATLQTARMQVYFIFNDDYFQKGMAKELETVVSPEDNDERSIFFIRGSLETVKKLRWIPDVVHCQGWIGALTPFYLKYVYKDDPTYTNVKIVVSLFNDKFEGTLDERLADKLKMDGVPTSKVKPIKGKSIDYYELMKLAMDASDAICIAEPDVEAELIEYARATGKPLMEYPGEENYIEAYANFYRSI